VECKLKILAEMMIPSGDDRGLEERVERRCSHVVSVLQKPSEQSRCVRSSPADQQCRAGFDVTPGQEFGDEQRRDGADLHCRPSSAERAFARGASARSPHTSGPN
jgi:hypothetical protein